MNITMINLISKYELFKICVALITLILFSNTSFAEETHVDGNDLFEKKISLKCDGRTMQEVLQELFLTSGVEVIYEANLASSVTNCNYNDLNIEKIIHRLFKNHNVGVLIDTDAKMIIVQVFGSSNYMVASKGADAEVMPIPFIDDMSAKELAELHALQFEEYQEQLNNDEQIVPGVNIARGDLRTLHENQLSDYHQELDDETGVLLGEDITRGELKALHEEQDNEYQKDLNDDTQKIAGASITRSELRNLHEKQYNEYQKELNDPNAIVPGIGISRSELKKLHESQTQL